LLNLSSASWSAPARSCRTGRSQCSTSGAPTPSTGRSWNTVLDISENAIRYAEGCGILDGGLAIDLENRDPTPEEAELLSGVDIIVSTGCVGYVTNKTFQRLAKVVRGPRAPWVASFVLRMFPYDEITATLADRGLVTELYEGATFVQRRFADPEEMEATIRAVEARGLDSYGRETDGLYHANLFISRPPADIERQPIQKLITVVSGADKLWNVSANVLSSFGPAVRNRARRAIGLSAPSSWRSGLAPAWRAGGFIANLDGGAAIACSHCTLCNARKRPRHSLLSSRMQIG
jgi:hypothetical protein